MALWVSSASLILTWVEARVNAPSLFLFSLSFFAIVFRFRIDFAMLPWSFESFSSWAYMYVNALLERMIVFEYRELMMLALRSISQITEKASRSTLDRNEHKFSVSSLGNMSVLLSTRYTVVHLFRASKSRAESGRT